MQFVMYIASGLTYLPGVLLVGGVGALPLAKSRGLRLAKWLALILGLAFVATATVPAPLWLFTFGGAGVVACFATELAPGGRLKRRAHAIARVALGLSATAAIALELPHQLGGQMRSGGSRTVAVIGDSLSAGLNPGDMPWPALLARDHDVAVRNLAVAGATSAGGRHQADQLARADRPESRDELVVVFIGGNDLIARRPIAEFEADLDYILDVARRNGRPVAMVELPLVPGFAAYGATQRRLAARHGVTLIPRWKLALILAREDATVDGIHLTPAGAAAVEGMIWNAIRGSLPVK